LTVRLPTFAELADPRSIAPEIREGLRQVDPDAADPRNLFRVHWYNAADRRGVVAVPEHIVLPESLTGVAARIVVALGNRFPLIRAHKVLAAYACLAPRLVTGGFDPATQKAVWPSTGNYCRGGVAISRIMGCRGVAILPEGMSAERFRWLESWVNDPGDIIRTPGSESNVKEIYDACAVLARDPSNVVLNQFSEFANYAVHYHCTGRALETVAEHVREQARGAQVAAFVAASGSAGTLGAGDYLKERSGVRVVAVEALECPTLLYNGFGEHNIQGIGDKHVPLIHNVMNTDLVAAVSDRATDALHLLFNTSAGREYLVARRGVPEGVVEQLANLGLSGIGNIVAAIKTARYYRLGADDVLLTLATDGAEMYATELARTRQRRFGGTFDRLHAAETYGQHLAGAATDHVLELSARDRERIFNLGYYTWVEQQGISLADFQARRDQAFWRRQQQAVFGWDESIVAFNQCTGAALTIP
jgi:cysteine synthase